MTGLRFAEFCAPGDDHAARILRQVGVEEVTTTMPRPTGAGTSDSWAAALRTDAPWDRFPMRILHRFFDDLDLRIAVIEDSPPLDRLRLGLPGREEELEHVAGLVRVMGELGIPVLCINWMAVTGWARTSILGRGRGGAGVLEYDHALVADLGPPRGVEPVSKAQMWGNVRWFLERIIPVCEAAGVRLAMHPDDPPLPEVRGIARIQSCLTDAEELLAIVDSPANGITLCHGNYTLMTDDLPAAIVRLAATGRVNFVHVRDVRGTPERFVETFHDAGPTDTLACLRAYHAAGVDVPFRIDHSATLDGDSNARPGYSLLGQLWAVGYVGGLLEASARTG
jgi:mannonate dehydratase